jgi:hypothetical protein
MSITDSPFRLDSPLRTATVGAVGSSGDLQGTTNGANQSITRRATAFQKFGLRNEEDLDLLVRTTAPQKP